MSYALAAPEARVARPRSLFGAMTAPGMPDWFYDRELPLPDRKAGAERKFGFDPSAE